MANQYSKKVYNAVAKADMTMLGVRLGAVCIDAHIPAQVVSGWMGISRQAVYYWFTGVTDIAERHREKVEEIVSVLTYALDDGVLPAKDLPSAMAVIKRYKKMGGRRLDAERKQA